MNQRSVITPAVRFLGLVFVATSLPEVGRFVHDLVQATCMGNGLSILSPFIQYDAEEEVLSRVGWLALFAIGLYLFLDGRWAIRRMLRGLDGSCANCGYDLRGVAGAVCPECGSGKGS
jgi:hypothetical protein